MSLRYDSILMEQMYNNRALVPEHPEHFHRWAADSAEVRRTERCELDLRFGEEPGEVLDIFPARQSGAPVLVFIHGGYWRSLDKSDHSFVAPAFTREGVCVVMPNYDLCPAVTVPQITMQVARALAWTWRHIAQHGGDPGRISVAGHSAGGQLAAMMLACQWPHLGPDLPANLVKNALSVSGLYDLEPIMHTPFLQQTLHLTQQQVRQASPALLPAPASGKLYTVTGGNESEEYLRQNRLIREAWGERRVPVCEALAGLNHFTALEALAQPGHRVHRLALELLKG
jgi:arylformamidase